MIYEVKEIMEVYGKNISEECYKAISKVWTWEEQLAQNKFDKENPPPPGMVRIRYGSVELCPDYVVADEFNKVCDESDERARTKYHEWLLNKKKNQSWFKRYIQIPVMAYILDNNEFWDTEFEHEIYWRKLNKSNKESK